jgi:hypothetical protein
VSATREPFRWKQFGRRALALALALGAMVAPLACGSDRALTGRPDSGVPTMPTPMPGQATLAGVVRDASGAPVAGATLRIAETDLTATSDATGAYSIAVPSDSTVTVVASADGFAKTFEESVTLADGVVASGFDVRLLAPTDVTGKNALAGVASPDKRGVMALRLKSSDAGCSLAGATLAVWPPDAGTVVYSQPGTAGALDQPDSSLQAVQGGAEVAAWLVGVVPPGNMLSLRVTQAGCQSAMAPSAGGMLFTGDLRADAGALTEARLFLAGAQ